MFELFFAAGNQDLISCLHLVPPRRFEYPAKPRLGYVDAKGIDGIFTLELYRRNPQTLTDWLIRVGRAPGRVDIFGKVAQGDDRIAIVVKILHISGKIVRFGIDPRMIHVRHTVKRQDSNLSVPGLLNSPDKIIKRPVRPRGSGSRNQQRMVFRRVINRASVSFVRIGKLRPNAASGKKVTFFLKNLYNLWTVMITRVDKRHRRRDTVLLTALLNVFEFSSNLFFREWYEVRMAAGMVADLKTGLVNLLGVFPGQIVFLIPTLAVFIRFGYEERRPKAITLQQRCHIFDIRLTCVIKCENH
ncbi:hypothetical protein ES703_107609 [subsurface metagenome]